MSLIDSGAHRPAPRPATTLVAALLLFLTTTLHAAEWDEQTVLDQVPGRMVDVGGHRLHLDCRGTGAPVVILDSGIGGFSLEWARVRSALSDRLTVCAYDRAGYGWSDPGPTPRTAARNAAELHTLLSEAGLPPPYLLVGHSFGGFDVRLFAARYADVVAGVVLIDSSTPDQFERLPAGALPAPSVSRPLQHVIPSAPEGLSADDQLLALRLMLLPKGRAAMLAELDAFRASAGDVRRAPDLGALPLVVVSRGRAQFDADAGGIEAEATWDALQADLLRLSRDSARLVVVGAGHVVHLERPDVVVRAIGAVAAAARADRPVALLGRTGSNRAMPKHLATALAGTMLPVPGGWQVLPASLHLR